MIRVNIKELKSIVSKLNLAIEKNAKLNPKSGWIEIKTISGSLMKLKVSNYDYFVEACVPICCEDFTEESSIHATVIADTFIPLISKTDVEEVTFDEVRNNLVIRSDKNEYTLPIMKEDGKVVAVGEADFHPTNCIHEDISGEDLVSIADINAKGLIDATFSRDYQQYIYVDGQGAITFTENIYVNDFTSSKFSEPYEFLLNATQAKMLKVFAGLDEIDIQVEVPTAENYSSAKKVRLQGGGIEVIFSVQSDEMTDKFPCIKIRDLAKNERQTHAILSKKAIERALSRLMVFDKKFDATILDYSQLEFSENSVLLRSIKNHNFEVIDFESGVNTVTHTSMIRFADLQNQLKAITSDKIDLSYGESTAIVINDGRVKQLIPEIVPNS